MEYTIEDLIEEHDKKTFEMLRKEEKSDFSRLREICSCLNDGYGLELEIGGTDVELWKSINKFLRQI